MIEWNTDQSWTLFLDRDGVINERIIAGYITDVQSFKFLPGVLPAIELLSKHFGKIVVVTNQQGIAKGLMTEEDLKGIHQYMHEEVEKHGGKIHKSYYAPGKSSPDNMLRKPNPGMALLAQRQHEGIDFNKSVMVGDTDSDIIFGKKLGMKTVRIQTAEKISVEADVTVLSLIDFAKSL